MALREEVESLTGDGPWAPAADWIDEDTHLTLVMDVPGVAAEHLALQEEGDTVTVSGQRPAPERRLVAERPGGSFRRTLGFPEPVLPQSGEAQLIAGVLTVRFQKRHPTIDVGARELPENRGGP